MLIQHGENGLLVKSDDEWLAALESLVRDPALRQRMAAWVLFVRYHLRRLPLRRLLPHVWHKLRSAVAPAA